MSPLTGTGSGPAYQKPDTSRSQWEAAHTYVKEPSFVCRWGCPAGDCGVRPANLSRRPGGDCEGEGWEEAHQKGGGGARRHVGLRWRGGEGVLLAPWTQGRGQCMLHFPKVAHTIEVWEGRWKDRDLHLRERMSRIESQAGLDLRRSRENPTGHDEDEDEDEE